MHIEIPKKDNEEFERISLPSGVILILSDGSELEVSDRGNGYLRIWARASVGQIMRNEEEVIKVVPDTKQSIFVKADVKVLGIGIGKFGVTTDYNV